MCDSGVHRPERVTQPVVAAVPNPLTIRVLSEPGEGRGLEGFESLDQLYASWDLPQFVDRDRGLRENTRNPP